MQIIGLFLLGGFVCGLMLILEYLRLLFSRKSRPPWSRMLGTGWGLFAISVGLFCYSQYTPKKNLSWQDGWSNGLAFVAFCVW